MITVFKYVHKIMWKHNILLENVQMLIKCSTPDIYFQSLDTAKKDLDLDIKGVEMKYLKYGC